MDKSKSNKEKINPVRMIRTNIAVNIVLGIVIMLLIFGIIANIISYNRFSEEFFNEYSENAFRIARAAESYVNPDQLDDYLKISGDSLDYRKTYTDMTTLCNNVNAQFIYVIEVDTTDYNHITFVFNTVNKNSGFEPYEVGFVRETTNEDYKEKYRKLYNGESDEETVIRDQGLIESGSHITAMLALHRKDGSTAGILCVQRQMDALTNSRQNFFISITVVTAFLAVAVSLIFSIYLRRSLITPIRLITNETKRFSADPSPSENALSDSIRSLDEIGVLANSVDKMERETLDYIGDITAMTAEKERIGTELEVASAIQQGMLTSVSPQRVEFDIAASMTPAKEVGGDFYDFFMIDDDRLGMVMADVSGKGIPAAMFMTVTKVLINDAAFAISSPAEILRFVNERICQNNKMDMFVTVWLGILEISAGTVTAANAGHEYPAIYRSGKSFSVLKDKHGFVIGGMSGMKYKDYTIKLERGDSVFLYTDGVCEATNKDDELYGEERMVKALNKSPDAKPSEILQIVKEDVDTFVSDAPQFDDLTVMCLKYYGKDQ